jgi:nitrate/TMAO reductase-like tetraheme cytochrome c subunit
MSTAPGGTDSEKVQQQSLLRRYLKLGWGPRLGIATGIVAMMLALVLGVVYATDNPQFCTNCHEMQPYVDAWAAGPHHDRWCVDCHVGQGLPIRTYHKLLAFKEIYLHFTSRPLFPLEEEPVLPHGTCAACHGSVQVKQAKTWSKYVKAFSHNGHAAKTECQSCHKVIGHEVGAPALADFGAYNPMVEQASYRTRVAAVDRGVANLPNHVKVTCTKCHDLAKTGCSACHKPKHKARGKCEECHKAGTKFEFTHTSKTTCEKCHTPPDDHRQLENRALSPCGDCHQHPGRDFAFTHTPNPLAPCHDCHNDPPKNHFQPAGSGVLPGCENCHHHPGQDWAFKHPDLPTCGHCHVAPAWRKKHPTSGLCGNCHEAGVSFAFRHPPTNAPHMCMDEPCIACHPNDYENAFCTCHATRQGLQQGHPDRGL